MIIAGTGLDSFTNPADITALYPFPGFEVVFVVVGVLLLLGWHIRQMRDENKEYDEALELYERVGIERAMHFGGVSHLSADEDIDEVRAHVGGPDEERENPPA
ncbi:MAG: hypothetical protein H0U15_08280 [Geodermatophilaceae bacterium]|nr:hypothetical protein [Geodermatophilaceae bacterium]